MKFVTGENGRKPYPDSVSSTTKFTWSDGDANAGSQLCENINSRPVYFQLPLIDLFVTSFVLYFFDPP